MAFAPAVASGQTARVIMQFATTAERDAAFNRLLDRGAAVRAVDTEGGPALVVFGSAAAFSGELSRASQVSLDAGVACPRHAAPRARHLDQEAPVELPRRRRITHHRAAACRSRSLTPASRRTPTCLEPHPRLQGFRHRRHHAGRQLRPRHACRRHRRWKRRAFQWRLCGHCARRGHRGVAGARRRLLGQHQRRDRRAGMDRPPSRHLQHQGRQHLARPRRARVDLHRSAGAGRRAPVAQGCRGGHRRGQQGHQSGDRQSGLRRRRRAVQCAVGDLRRLTRHQGFAGIRGRSRFGFKLARPDAVRSARQAGPGCAGREHRFAGGEGQPPVQRVSGSAPARCQRQAGVLHAVGHEHGRRPRWPAPRCCCCARTSSSPSTA